MLNCILARIYGTLFSSSDSFPKFHPIISSKGNFNYNLAYFLCYLVSPLLPYDYSAKILFLLFLKLRMQIFPENILFPTMRLVFLLIFHFKKPVI